MSDQVNHFLEQDLDDDFNSIYYGGLTTAPEQQAPSVDDLVNNLVQSRLEEARQQLAETMKREYVEKERNMQQQIEALNNRLAAAVLDPQQNVASAVIETRLVAGPAPPDSVIPANTARKRRRQSIASVSDIPATSPSRNTRASTRRASTGTASDAPAALALVPAAPRSSMSTSTAPMPVLQEPQSITPQLASISPPPIPRSTRPARSSASRTPQSSIAGAAGVQSTGGYANSLLQTTRIRNAERSALVLRQTARSTMPLETNTRPSTPRRPTSTTGNLPAQTTPLVPIRSQSRPSAAVNRPSSQAVEISDAMSVNSSARLGNTPRSVDAPVHAQPVQGFQAPRGPSGLPPTAGISHLQMPPAQWQGVVVQDPPSQPPAGAQTRRRVVKSAAQIHRFLPQDMPPDVGGLKKAMHLHIRILWALLDAKDIPKDPTPQMLHSFSYRFNTEADLLTTQNSGSLLIPLHLIQIGTAMSNKRGYIANQARLVEENILAYVQACLSRFGLESWCPDLRQTALSLYNSACRIIALDTFKQALISHAYMHLAPNTRYASNMALLIKLYDHFVFSYMLDRYRQEARAPGSVEQELKNTPQYQKRKRLTMARLDYLKKNAYPERYCQIINTKATSDDEYDPASNTSFIKKRPERSAQAERFIRILEVKRERYTRQTGKKWPRIRRVVPEHQEVSSFEVLPENMPVDYFDPDFFNELELQVRYRVAKPKVAFLANIEDSLQGRKGDEALDDNLFTLRRRHEVFNKYRLVSPSEFSSSQQLATHTHNEEVEELGGSEGEGDWIDPDEARSEDEVEEVNWGGDDVNWGDEGSDEDGDYQEEDASMISRSSEASRSSVASRASASRASVRSTTLVPQ